MPTVSRFVIWERPPDFRKTPPKLASVLGEVGIESLDRVHGREPSFLGRDVSEIERLLVSSNLGMLAHACGHQEKPRRTACSIKAWRFSNSTHDRTTVYRTPGSGRYAISCGKASTISCTSRTWAAIPCERSERSSPSSNAKAACLLQKSISNRAGSLLRLCFPLKLLAYQRKPRGSFGGRESTMCTIY